MEVVFVSTFFVFCCVGRADAGGCAGVWMRYVVQVSECGWFHKTVAR